MTEPYDKKKVGRKPKGYKPPYIQTLQIKKENITILFQDSAQGTSAVNTMGTFTDFFKPHHS